MSSEPKQSKCTFLQAYVAIKKLDVVCLSEIYLDSSNLSDDGNFNIPCCSVVRANHSSITKKGGVCIYFKNSLPCDFISLYRSPRQSKD